MKGVNSVTIFLRKVKVTIFLRKVKGANIAEEIKVLQRRPLILQEHDIPAEGRGPGSKANP